MVDSDARIAFEHYAKHLAEASTHRQSAQWEDAFRELKSAETFVDQWRQKVLYELGGVERRLGRFKNATKYLEKALAITRTDELQRIHILGELAIVYQHSKPVQAAKALDAATIQYQDAKDLASKEWQSFHDDRGSLYHEDRAIQVDAQACRAVGNIGLFDYLQFQRDHDNVLLHKSILHFEERVQRAKNLQAALQKHVTRQDQDDNTQAQLAELIDYHAWESIGYDRLTLARISNGELAEALRCGEKSQSLTQKSKNSTIRGLSRFFYGYALLKNRKMDMAKERLGVSGLHPDMCTSAIALCREPLDNYPRYLEEITELGLDMEHYDENGYSALDYTVFQDSSEMKQVVLRRLREGNYEGAEKDESRRAETIQRLEDESILKRHYREMFQECLRPNLMKGGRDSIQKVRDSHAGLLTKDETEKANFDQLRIVSYADFIAHGRLPSFGDGITREYSSVQAAKGDKVVKECVVFFSYKWRIPRENRPDDSTKTEHGEGTQYGRMCAALNSLLDIRSGGNWHGSSLHSDNLYIWLVSAVLSPLVSMVELSSEPAKFLRIVLASIKRMPIPASGLFPSSRPNAMS